MEYDEFLKQKEMINHSHGHKCHADLSKLFEYQKPCVEWATQKGRSALFEDCGLGKSIQQLKFAESVNIETDKPVIIFAPLAVVVQTKTEGLKFGIKVNVCKNDSDVINGINITNYKKIEHFDTSIFSGVILDESSILKSFTSATKNMLIEKFKHTPYKLACTATPSPNDFVELGNHAEFLGIMTRNEMLAMFFVHDGGETSKWRLKGHAQAKFWRWLSSWALMIKKPSDIGFSDDGFELPPLNINYHIVDHGKPISGNLFKDYAVTLNDQRKARKESMQPKLKKIKEIIDDDSQWLIWCDLNDESDLLKKNIPGAVEVKGSDKPEFKERELNNFALGTVNKLVTKTSIAGFGMNYQSCNNMAFFGLSHSYESFYQAIRRCWRYGQTKPVNVHVIVSDVEQPIIDNIQRKHEQAELMSQEMVKQMAEFTIAEIKQTTKETTVYNAKKHIKIPAWLKGEEECQV